MKLGDLVICPYDCEFVAIGKSWGSFDVPKGTPMLVIEECDTIDDDDLPHVFLLRGQLCKRYVFDLKIVSIPVHVTTHKLHARWSPELAQDLNAYNSLDAEVELDEGWNDEE